ncbi:hypothetical protein BKA62DRAFT_693514 [Auriculariales sp. MPI-PUGE-AT-0066]|nr:hypothetical protein BKA62DRAFT_693514 [Auriculariales sp. MPI-PUGE-AT-0066]
MAAGSSRADIVDYRVSPALETVYLSVVIGGGQILIPVLLILSCIRGFSRHPSLLQFLASWLWYSVATSLLLYTGNGYQNNPPHGICFAQVALQQAGLLIISFSAIALMLQLFFTLPTVSTSKPFSKARDFLLVSMPYILSLLYVGIFCGVAARAPDYMTVERGRFTCRISDGKAANFFNKFVPAIISSSMIICLCMSIYMLHKTVKRLFGMNWSLKDGLQSSSGRSWLPILTRFAVFGLYAVLCIVASLIMAFTPQGPAHEIVDWYTVTLPLAAFFIFVPWPSCGCKREHKEKSVSETVTHNLPMMMQSSVETLVNSAAYKGHVQEPSSLSKEFEYRYHYVRKPHQNDGSAPTAAEFEELPPR